MCSCLFLAIGKLPEIVERGTAKAFSPIVCAVMIEVRKGVFVARPKKINSTICLPAVADPASGVEVDGVHVTRICDDSIISGEVAH